MEQRGASPTMIMIVTTIVQKSKMKPSHLIWCDVSLKVKASGSGTSTTTAWTAPQTPPPGKSGQKSSTTPATQGRTRSEETEQIEILAVLKLFLTFFVTPPTGGVCSSFPPAPARWASTWWRPTGSSSLTPPGTLPMTFRVSSGSTALARPRRSLCTGSSPR